MRIPRAAIEGLQVRFLHAGRDGVIVDRNPTSSARLEVMPSRPHFDA